MFTSFSSKLSITEEDDRDEGGGLGGFVSGGFKNQGYLSAVTQQQMSNNNNNSYQKSAVNSTPSYATITINGFDNPSSSHSSNSSNNSDQLPTSIKSSKSIEINTRSPAKDKKSTAPNQKTPIKQVNKNNNQKNGKGRNVFTFEIQESLDFVGNPDKPTTINGFGNPQQQQNKKNNPFNNNNGASTLTFGKQPINGTPTTTPTFSPSLSSATTTPKQVIPEEEDIQLSELVNNHHENDGYDDHHHDDHESADPKNANSNSTDQDEGEIESGGDTSGEEGDGVSSSSGGEDNSTTNAKVVKNIDYIPLTDSVAEQVKLSNTINLHSFTISHLVGKGGFGKVHQVIKKDTGQIYALKTLTKNHIILKKSALNTIAEKDILKRINHPFIVKLHYAFQNEKKLYLVMDFINGGQLFYHLQKESMFSENQVRFYIAELVLALEHLHGLNIVHRDLKPENILLDSEGHCILTDFGLAKEQVVDDSSVGSLCGTFEYMAPEMINGKAYGKAVDWWSIGILMFDMLAGKPPFESKNRLTLQEKILNEKPKFPSFISSSARSLINNLLVKDPKQRLGYNGVTKIKQHPFFKPIQWRKLEAKEIVPPFIPQTKGIADISNFDLVSLKDGMRDSYSSSPSLSSSQQAIFDGFSFVRSPRFYPTTTNLSTTPSIPTELSIGGTLI
eukprot:gene4193-5248_t